MLAGSRRVFLVLQLLALLAAGAARAEMGDLTFDRAFGQADLFHSIGLPIGAATFAEPRGVAIDRSVSPNRVFVADSAYSRVLGWSDVEALVNGAPADLVIGQPDASSFGCNGEPAVTSSKPPATASNLCRPYGIDVGPDGSLYVADRDNCRVQVYFDPFTTDGEADQTLGTCGSASLTTMRYPVGVAVAANGDVYVADYLDRRVLQFDGPLAANDLLPDRVLLQPDFTSGFLEGTHFPTDVAIDSDGVLYVGTRSQVLRFDDPLNDSQISAAYGTTGCNNEGCSSSGCIIEGESAETTCMPEGVAIDAAGGLYVGDAGNNRVLAFDEPKTSPIPARVYGQPDFGGDSGLFNDECNDGGAGPSSLCTFVVIRLTLGGTFRIGVGLDVDDQGRLYVADTLNHRVLRYDAPESDPVADVVLGHLAMNDVRRPLPTIEGPYVSMLSSQLLAVDSVQSRVLVYGSTNSSVETPIAVIGQPDFATTGCNSGGLSASSLCGPTAAFAESFGPLWIADTGNNRVLRFDYPWLEYDSVEKRYVVKEDADAVYGQPDFVSNGCAAGADGLCGPRGIARVGSSGRLYISDSGNNRIVRHDAPLSDGTADLVIGQPDFVTVDCNSGGRDAHSLCDPRGIRYRYQSGQMFVADRGNHRVLIYEQVEQFPGGAEAVFGQNGSFTTGACGAGPAGLCSPSDVDFDSAGQVLVADTDNHRVLQYDLPLTDGDADRVFGQPDLVSTDCNGGGVSDVSLCSPVSVGLYRAFGDKLFVGDAGNQRIVKVDAPYCAITWNLADKIAGGADASGPWKTKVRVKRSPSGDQLKFRGNITMWEEDGYGEFSEEPLLTLRSAGDIRFREKVPTTGCTFRGETERCRTEYLKNERDTGVDDYKMVDVFRFAPRQHDRVRYSGRAVGLDLSSFAESQATLEAQFGSVCFTSDLQCTHRTRSAVCK